MVHNNITFSLICLKSRKIDGKRGLCEIKKDKTNQNQSYVKKKPDLNWILTSEEIQPRKPDFNLILNINYDTYNQIDIGI